MKKGSAAAFSLVELTLALGIAAFCLIAVFGLVPVGVQTNRNATSQTAATNILSSVVSDIRANIAAGSQVKSKLYNIGRNKSAATTVCFDGQGGYWSSGTASATCPATHYRFRLDVKITKDIPAGVVYPGYAWLKVSWPAASNPVRNPAPITPSGSVETVTTFFVQ